MEHSQGQREKMKSQKTLVHGIRKKPKALTIRRKKLISIFLENVIKTPSLYGKVGTKEWVLELIGSLNERVKRQKTSIADIRAWFKKSSYFKPLLDQIPEWQTPLWIHSDLIDETEDDEDEISSDEEQPEDLSGPATAQLRAPSQTTNLRQPNANVLPQNRGLNEQRNWNANETGASSSQNQPRPPINLEIPEAPFFPRLLPLPRADQILQNYTNAMMRMVDDMRALEYHGGGNTSVNWEICFHALNILNLTSTSRN